MLSLLLVDLSHLFWTNYHATADQTVSEAFERTVAKVHSLRAGYERVACCIDMPPYFRKELAPTYKAQREQPTPQAIEQFARVKARLEADGVPLIGAKGFEADDIAATIAHWSVHTIEGGKLDSVVLATGDKDWFQLVDDDADIRVLSTTSGKMYRRTDVIEKLGVSPDMVPDWLALVGDKSDNIPGIPGIGPKIAAKLLMQYGSLHEVLAHADEQTEKLAASLIEHAEAARLARKLVELRRDAPIQAEDIFLERKPQPIREVTMPGKDNGFDDEQTDDESDTADLISAPPATPRRDTGKPAPEPKSEPRQTASLAKTSAPAELVMPTAGWAMQLEPRNLKQAWWLAEQMCNSRLFQQFGSPEAAYMVLLRGRALGLDATTALSAFHNIEGKIAMHADLIEALVLRSGKAEYFEIVETTNQRATYATKRVGGRREVVITFSIEDALNAGLVERSANGVDGFRGYSKTGKPSNWDKYRSTMLRHRAKTQLARAVYSDVVLGLYTPDEISDGRATIDAEGEAA